MSKTAAIWIVIILLVVIVAGVVYAMTRSSGTATANPYSQNSAYDATAGLPPTTDANASANAPITTTVTTSVTQPASEPVTVTYSDQGFSPKSVSIALGHTVRFVNNSSHQMWIASNPHPIHNGYDGTTMAQHCANGVDTMNSFDECTAVPPGTVYSFTFQKAGTFGYHNHLMTSDTGTVTVK